MQSSCSLSFHAWDSRDFTGAAQRQPPFLNDLEQGKSTSQMGEMLALCRRFGIWLRLRVRGETECAPWSLYPTACGL